MFRKRQESIFPSNWGVFAAYVIILLIMILYAHFQQNSISSLQYLNVKVSDLTFEYWDMVTQEEPLYVHDFYSLSDKLETILQTHHFYQVAVTVPNFDKDRFQFLLETPEQPRHFDQIFHTLTDVLHSLDQNLSQSMKTLNFTFIGLSIMLIFISIFLEVERYQRYMAEIQMKEIDRKLITLMDQEKHRIAMELHDDVAQRLSLVKQYLMQHHSKSTQNADTAPLRNIKTAITRIRTLSGELRNPKREELSFQEQLKLLFSDFASLSSIQLRYGFTGLKDQSFSELLQLHVYRIFQELLSNGLRHSGADEIEIRVTVLNSNLMIYYGDNGIGTENRLESINYRIHILEGKMKQVEKEESGMHLMISIPVKKI